MIQLAVNEKRIHFYRMHSGFNKFMVLDGRERDNLTPYLLNRLLEENKEEQGIARFDQLLYLKKSPAANCNIIVYNTDGSQSGMCVNGLRCIARLLFDELLPYNRNVKLKLQINDKVYSARSLGERIGITMPQPSIDWQLIPLSREMSTPVINYECGEFRNPIALTFGNPHLVFLLDKDYDLKTIDLNKICQTMEKDPLFPQGANISFAKVMKDNLIHARIWERGVGETQSCGSGACAIVWAAKFKDLIKTAEGSVIEVAFTSGQYIMIELLKDGGLESRAGTELLAQGSYSIE